MPTFIRKRYGAGSVDSIGVGGSPVLLRYLRCTFRVDAEWAVTVISYMRAQGYRCQLPRSGIDKYVIRGVSISICAKD